MDSMIPVQLSLMSFTRDFFSSGSLPVCPPAGLSEKRKGVGFTSTGTVPYQVPVVYWWAFRIIRLHVGYCSIHERWFRRLSVCSPLDAKMSIAMESLVYRYVEMTEALIPTTQ
mgnify:CR=1 FL=1